MSHARILPTITAAAVVEVASAARTVTADENATTFANPLYAGADPCVVFHEGFYYWCGSERDVEIAVYRSAQLTVRGERVVVWRAPPRGPFSRQLWAPELHRMDGRWYIYVAASNGQNETHRMIVLESVGELPTSEFRFKAELYTGDDIATGARNRWAIDGTVLTQGGRRYLIWSGWEDRRDEQWLYIATLENPWTVSSNRVRICHNADFLWEHVDETAASRGLNEAPQVLVRGERTMTRSPDEPGADAARASSRSAEFGAEDMGGTPLLRERVFLIYSAGASWLPTYKLGMLELVAGGDPMNPRDWTKRAEPVFQSTEATWGVGHCGFTRSPDGREEWIVFHAKLERAANWNRVVQAQRFHWNETGAPVFGEPIARGVTIDRPSTANANATESDITPRATESAEVALGRAALLSVMGEESIVKNVRIVEQ